MKACLIILLGSFWANWAWAVTEIDFNYTLERKSFGENKENKIVGQTYYAAVAYYFRSSTAIEINGSYDYKKTTTYLSDPLLINTATLYGSGNKLKTWSYGAGIRQALAPASFPVRPLIGFGWARQEQSDKNFYLLDNGGGTINLEGMEQKVQQDVAYILAALKIALSAHWSLKISALGTFKPFHWNEITKDMRYLGGLMITF